MGKINNTPPFPDKKYSIIYADPPWTYPKSGGKKSSRGMAKQHYNTMNLEDIKALPVGDIAATNCALLLWATYPQLPAALEVIKAWGFEYYGLALCWVKKTSSWKDFFGMGHWFRANPEPCLLAFKGKMKPHRHDIPQLMYANVGKHSEKPTEARERIINQCGDLSRIELFARQRAEGWDCWGNEV